MAKIWGIAPWQGKVIDGSDTRTVMDQYNADEAAKPKSTEYKNTEEALGPPSIAGGLISLDPVDYIGPGALAKAGAAIKGVLTGGSALMVGAFRSSNNTMLSRNITETIAKQMEFAKRPGIVEKALAEGAREEAMDYLLHGKLTQKEIAKYGTPEFVLDKWLDSTNRYPGSDPTRFIRYDNKGDLAYSAEAGLIRNANQTLIRAVRDRDNALEIGLGVYPGVEKEIEKATATILKQGRLFEDVNLAQKQGKTVLHARGGDVQDLSNDISSGIETLMKSLNKYEIPVESIRDKSFQQIASIVHKADDESVRILKKSMEAKNKTIIARTAELFNTQRDPDAGMFVKLTDPKDLAHETDVLNHCIGAVCRDNNKYIPAFDTVTGQANKGTSHSSFAQYNNALTAGKSEFYSYRPKGLPEFTIEVSPSSWNGERIIAQAYGKEDAALNKEQLTALEGFAKAKGITFTKDTGRIVDDMGGEDWIPE